jgi:putative Mg2+ transporter-C (MgtC) family protein
MADGRWLMAERLQPSASPLPPTDIDHPQSIISHQSLAIISSMSITETELLIRLGAAIVLGGAIGYERELREQPAGLRTHLLVALASATFALVSFQGGFFQNYPRDVLERYDPGRIASNIVAGIGFLGGGAILHAGATIKGLTTAASLWLVAAIGLAAGGGMVFLSAAVTALSLVALVALRWLVEVPRKQIVRLNVRIDLEGDFLSRAALVEFLAPVAAEVTGVDYTRNISNNRSRLIVNVRLPDESHEEPLMKRLEGLSGLRRVKVERSV